jgi:hypothetical protein
MQGHVVSIPPSVTLLGIAAPTYLFGTLAIIFSAPIPVSDPKTAPKWASNSSVNLICSPPKGFSLWAVHPLESPTFFDVDGNGMANRAIFNKRLHRAPALSR